MDTSATTMDTSATADQSTDLPLAALRRAIIAVAVEVVGELAAQRPITLERPPKPELGDYSTNAALMLAGAAKSSPRELSQRLGDALRERLAGDLLRFEVAGPGFLNLFLADSWHLSALRAILDAREGFGGGGAKEPQRVLVEFVSANPTGPMHIGHARNAAYGDSLARLLSFHGHLVSREFYVNDAGSQIRKLGESIRALARGEEVPADGYQGEYVKDIVARIGDAPSGIEDAPSRIEDASSMQPDQLGRAAVQIMIGEIQASLARFNVLGYDHWQYESELHQVHEVLRGRNGEPVSAVQHALQLLEDGGHTYRSEGALWLRSSELGDDKDRVLMRSTGEHTYFASDIAYHQAKRERGFQRQLDVWGADHHGYVSRMRAAYQALGGDPDELELLIMQLVHLVRGGEKAQMSKRSGEFVTLDDLVEEIGVDAARWFLLSRSHDTTIDLDLDLAIKQSSENPVYYVQYAHARIASMFEKAGRGAVSEAVAQLARAGGDATAERPDGDALARQPRSGDGLAQPLHPSERALVKQLLDFPAAIEEAAAKRGPHRIAAYALELAQSFTAFYRDCKVVGAEPAQVESLRIALCFATRGAIARCLALLGVSAPQSM